MSGGPVIRKAILEDRPAIENLIAVSARELGRGDYSEQQIEAALKGIFGVDSDLIEDGTYFVAEVDGQLVACGGWSRRRTLFGGDRYGDRDSAPLDPATEAAKIRAFFVHPLWARKGLARAILERCESEARACGFKALELMATLPGVKLYAALGYENEMRTEYSAEGVALSFVRMRKEIQG